MNLCRFWLLLLLTVLALTALANENLEEEEEPHPDPNEEDYEGMIYIGRLDENGRRLSRAVDNGIKFIFGTSFDETHKEIEHSLLQHEHCGPDAHHDVANRGHQVKSREEVLKERRHKPLNEQGPKPFGHMDTHDLDGGAVPPHVVHIEPFFLDATLVTNKQFAKFVSSTLYETEAEKYAWSFVLSSFVPGYDQEDHEVDPEAEHWVAVPGAYWRQPEGKESSYKYREHHPVVHVSHRDAAEYCRWKGKRLPGEREWEAAARFAHWTPDTRTVYMWGDADDWDIANQHANLWGNGTFPIENTAGDGWRGTSPVQTYPANAAGFYDMMGNVWEWMRGGKHTARIVRGGSYVDSLDGSINHAATLGARSTVHGTTTTGNIGFRCAKSPQRRVEHHWKTWHEEEVQLGIEDEFGKRNVIPRRGSEGTNADDDDEWMDDDEVREQETRRKKTKVVKKRERLSNEL